MLTDDCVDPVSVGAPGVAGGHAVTLHELYAYVPLHDPLERHVCVSLEHTPPHATEDAAYIVLVLADGGDVSV